MNKKYENKSISIICNIRKWIFNRLKFFHHIQLFFEEIEKWRVAIFSKKRSVFSEVIPNNGLLISKFSVYSNNDDLYTVCDVFY